MSAVPDTRPYEMAVLRGAFDQDTARDIVQRGSAKLFTEPDLLSTFRAFQKLHFDRIPVTRESITLEMQTAAEVADEAIPALLDEILQLPKPSGITRLLEGLGVLQGRKELQGLKEYLDTPDAIRAGMAGAVSKINEFTTSIHSLSSKRPESLTDTLNRMLQRTEPAKTWAPGFGPLLDSRWRIRKGAYGVIGADSGSGKTAASINIALNIAKTGTHVGFISIEMTKEELSFRAAAIDAGVDSSRFEDNIMSAEEKAILVHTIRANKHVYDRIHVIDDGTLTAEQLHGKYNELITQYGCEVIFIDYIQRIGMSGKNNGKVDQVTFASETITAITKATGVATIALSVLNEENSAFSNNGSSNGKKRKGLSNLKNARAIGHDAAWVVIMTMDEGARQEDETKYVIFESVKSRKGGWFIKPLSFHGPSQRFTDDGAMVETI